MLEVIEMCNIVFNVLKVNGPKIERERFLDKAAIVGNVRKTQNLNSIFFHFETDGAPDYGWCDDLAARFPRLNFRLDYFELRGGFRGHIWHKDGKRNQVWYDASIDKLAEEIFGSHNSI